jgi:hypothetical protein
VQYSRFPRNVTLSLSKGFFLSTCLWPFLLWQNKLPQSNLPQRRGQTRWKMPICHQQKLKPAYCFGKCLTPLDFLLFLAGIQYHIFKWEFVLAEQSIKS